mgnify:CR=1 FL=1
MTKSKRGIWIIGFIIALFIISLYFDSYIVKGVSYLKNGFLDEFLIGLTFTSSEIIIFFFLTSLFLWNENKRKWILPLWFTLFLSTLVSFILKVAIQRPRPFQQGIIEISSFLVKNSYYVWDFSFPSNQTMLAFCTIPFLSKEFPKFKYVWIALACLVGFSRLYFGFHFLSDVIAGAAIGYLLGTLIIKAEKENKFWENIYWRIYNKFVK